MTRMKLMLLQDVKGVGVKNSIVDVADGYGRNFLLPRGFAKLADPAAVAELEKTRTAAGIRQEKAEKQAKHLSERLQGMVIEEQRQAAPSGTLYAALKEFEILAMVRKSVPHFPESARLVDYEPIKSTGEHEVKIQLAPWISPIKLVISLSSAA